MRAMNVLLTPMSACHHGEAAMDFTVSGSAPKIAAVEPAQRQDCWVILTVMERLMW